MHGDVGDQHGAAAAERDRHADHAPAGPGIEHPAHVLVGRGPVAGDAGDHAVGVPHRHHAGGEHVAVVVDEPLAVAQQIALALQAPIEELGVLVPPLGQAGVVHLDHVGEADAGRLERLADRGVAADQDRVARGRRCGRRWRRARSAAARPRQRRCAWGHGAPGRRCCAASRRRGRAGRRAAPRSPPCRRSAGAPRRSPWRPWRRRARRD